MQVLQQRLKLASVKAENGWSGMTLNEIEDVRDSLTRLTCSDFLRHLDEGNEMT